MPRVTVEAVIVSHSKPLGRVHCRQKERGCAIQISRVMMVKASNYSFDFILKIKGASKIIFYSSNCEHKKAFKGAAGHEKPMSKLF
jgi:hypothetical protein